MDRQQWGDTNSMAYLLWPMFVVLVHIHDNYTTIEELDIFAPQDSANIAFSTNKCKFSKYEKTTRTVRTDIKII